MYTFLSNLLSDKKGGDIFRCFSPWHLIYIALAVAAASIILLKLKGKDDATKERVMKTLVSISFGLYILDFFLMPLAYGEIDIEKLPFHACTAMCVMCFLSYRIPCLKEYHRSFALLGFISNFVYLIYPAGVMWHAVHPLSYRVIQTLIFHAIMSVYGLLVIIYERDKFDIKRIYRELPILGCMTLWAVFGNYVYNGTYKGEARFFNWFFVVRDPFYMIPETIAPFIMPFLNFAVFFVVEAIVYLILNFASKGVPVNDKN